MRGGMEELLSRQTSCCCAAALGRWRRGGGKYYDEMDDEVGEPPEFKARRSLKARWRGIWRRIVREGEAAPPSYDEDSYAMNFEDQGCSAWAVEPEFLSRSFSSVYANPSALLKRFDR